MLLTPGARVGSYQIVEALGAGGMGEVYRARDSKLGRDVAVKVLRADVAGDRERLARFAREARVLAALNHPNIAHVLELHDDTDSPALVMELVEGATLARRLDAGPLPLEEALEIARQIAEALEAAHERHIIHRDLKPANIKVRPDGLVKVLDFGLAKALDPSDTTAPSDQANSPTITSPAMTMRGVILGTAAYMAPEQAKGRPVDRRADIWAFGCVLYEMLTGRRPFEGEDITETIAAVVSKEPDWTALPAATPPSIRRFLQRLLVKNPKQRIDSAAVVRLELHEVEAALKSGATEIDASGSGARQRWRTPAMAATGLLAAAGAALATWASIPRPAPRVVAPVTRFVLPLPASQPLAQSFNAADIALSPDATHLAYTVGLQSQLMLRALDQLDGAPLEGITGARAPFFSPDGAWVGYFDQSGELRRVSIDGGRPIAICKVDGTSRGASWGADDVIVFATSNSRGLLSVPAAGGEPTMLAGVNAGERAYFFPSVLPGDQGVIYTVVSDSAEGPAVAMLDRDGGRTPLLRAASQAQFIADGYLTYASDESIWTVRFSPASRQLSGPPVRVADVDTSLVQPGVGANVTVSRRGTFAYVQTPAVQARTLAWIARSGSETAIAAPVGHYETPRLSREGASLALVAEDKGNYDIFTWNLSQDSPAQTLMRLTFAETADTYPVWLGSNHLINSGARPQNIFRRRADRGGGEERLTQAPTNQRALAVSPDDRQLIFEENTTDNAWNLMRLTLDGVSTPQPLLRTRFDERNAALSPDGRWMAYESNETGQTQIFVRPFPNVNDAVFRISQDGGRSPVWSPAGGELFFVNGTTMYSVGVQLAPAFRYESPKALFDAPDTLFDARQTLIGGAYRMYDVSKDGQRFLVVKVGRADDPSKTRQSLVVVHNWFENAMGSGSAR